MNLFFHVLGKEIPAYGLLMAIAIVFAGGLALFRVKHAGGDENKLLIISSISIGCALAGAWLLYLFVSYGVDRVVRDIQDRSFRFLYQGGLVYYGGLIGGILGFLLGVKVVKESELDTLCDAVIPCIPLGHAIGRIGCFFAGCCYGMAYNGPCAVEVFTEKGIVSTFPIQLVEAAANLVLFLALLTYTKKKTLGFRLLYAYLLLYGLVRFILEFFRGDLIRGGIAGFSTSQWISLALIMLSIMLLIAKPSLKSIQSSGDN